MKSNRFVSATRMILVGWSASRWADPHPAHIARQMRAHEQLIQRNRVAAFGGYKIERLRSGAEP